jgi:hypothetical protein
MGTRPRPLQFHDVALSGRSQQGHSAFAGASCPEQVRSALAMRGSSVLKDRWTPLIAWAVLGLAGLACVSACGHGLPFTTRYGAVTTLRPQLCISRRAATGTCFGGVSELQIAALTIGECVEVPFDPHTELLGERDVRIRRIRRMSGAGAGFVHSLWISARSGSCELPHRGARALADRDG